MPGALSAAVVSPSSTVLPQSLCTAFVRTENYPLLLTEYHDGTRERSLIVDTLNPPRSTRTWKLSKRLVSRAYTAPGPPSIVYVDQLAALRTFWETVTFGGYMPFYFYDPFDASGAIGSNYDATGVSVTGRVTVFFRGKWEEQVGLGRATIPDLLLVEVA